jgi:lipopolysaccharide transport system permease protein
MAAAIVRDAFRIPWRHRALIARLARREISARYRASFFGPLWAVAMPALMLTIYTVVFAGIFKSRWPVPQGGEEVPYALLLFAGLTIFNLLAEPINTSPHLVRGNVALVKQVVFPLEILPVVHFGVALFNASIAATVLLLVHLILRGVPPVSALWLPLIVGPVPLLALGFAWFLSSLGAFLRDAAHVAAPLTTILLFLSALFYPIEAVPPGIVMVVKANPMSAVIEQARAALFFGAAPRVLPLAYAYGVALTVFFVGFWWFRRTRSAFADVV